MARRIARENHIALSQVTGTGRRGRIEAGDVRAMLKEGASTPAVIQAAPGATASVYCVHG
ncbi:E3 binding domain-containing protein, partial [Halomonas marinisediminis]|uniref:E3 binding domain-containing protein n=1 Tax=Halomonas marinisediminis TaxID=2546095 RepID=UPI0034D5F79C